MKMLDVRIIKKKDLFSLLNSNVLGVIEYGEKRELFLDENHMVLPYQFIQVKSIQENFFEIWNTCELVTYRKVGNCNIGESKHFCLRAVTVNDTVGDHKKNAESAYNQIMKNLNLKKYRIIRFWNYVSEINARGNSQERYKEFCVGREKAFSQILYNSQETYPAATGIGIKGNNICISLLAVNDETMYCGIENPRQTPAYAYPKKYGNSSPKFSRGAYINIDEQKVWFVSGTASIIGSDTIYVDDVVKQTETTIENIEILLSSENLKKHIDDNPDIQNDLRCLKVYIRSWDDVPIIKTLCEKKFDKEKIIYMQNDICRKNLLVEIEGVWMKESK